MSVGAVALALVAGVLTSLSPCVLPILPLVLSAAASERKYGPVALAAGLAISFVLVGLFVATIGYSIGLTTELFRQVAAALMVILGAVLIFPPLQTRLALTSGPIGTMGGRPTYVERATEGTECLPAKLERAIGCMRLIAGRTKFAHFLKLFLQ
jgi:cytochrome c-type biogenesis protein